MTLIKLDETFKTMISEELSRIYDLAYENGKRDGKKELIKKIEKYFELKEKGEVNAK